MMKPSPAKKPAPSRCWKKISRCTDIRPSSPSPLRTTDALHSSEVLIKETGTASNGASIFLYELRADDVDNVADTMDTDAGRRDAILRTVEPIAGEVTLDHYETVTDTHQKVVAYRAWILR